MVLPPFFAAQGLLGTEPGGGVMTLAIKEGGGGPLNANFIAQLLVAVLHGEINPSLQLPCRQLFLLSLTFRIITNNTQLWTLLIL